MCNCNRIGTEEQVNEFTAVLKEYENQRDAIMVVLQKTQGIFGYIPEGTVKLIAKAIKTATILPASWIP